MFELIKNMDTEFCKFLGKVNEDGSITIHPLGRAKNSIDKPALPGWKDVVTEIVIDADYAKGLDGIEDYSHIIVVYWMDKEKVRNILENRGERAKRQFIT